MLIEQKNKENAEIQQIANELLKKGHLTERHKDEEQRISIIPNDEYRIRYSLKATEIAQKEVLWLTLIERLPVALTFYDEAFKKAFAKGVKWRTIAELNKPTDEILRFIENYKKENPNFAIRFAKPTLYVSFSVYDDKELNFSTEKLTSLANSPILSTNNEQLIKVIKDFFEYRWNTAVTEYQKKRTSKIYSSKKC